MVQFLTQLAYQGGPAVVVLVILYLLLRRDIKELKQDFVELKVEHKACQTERKDEEKALHGRATENAKEIARLKGRMNGGCHA